MTSGRASRTAARTASPFRKSIATPSAEPSDTPPLRDIPTTRSPEAAHARVSQPPANPEAPVMRTRKLGPLDLDRVFERAVAVAREVGLGRRRRRLGLGVDTALE